MILCQVWNLPRLGRRRTRTRYCCIAVRSATIEPPLLLIFLCYVVILSTWTQRGTRCPSRSGCKHGSGWRRPRWCRSSLLCRPPPSWRSSRQPMRAVQAGAMVSTRPLNKVNKILYSQPTLHTFKRFSARSQFLFGAHSRNCRSSTCLC